MSDSAVENELKRLRGIYPLGFDLSLERIKRLLNDLGNPQDDIPPVIHIAGTNGKGSTLSYCREILEQQGLLVHSHTSPYLVNWHEQYRLGKAGGSEYVKNELLLDVLRRAEKVNDGQKITIFELATVSAFMLFKENKADVTLLEVGLGGEYDATNVISKALATIITSISYDHVDRLGSDLTAIAKTKAGILKENTPLIIAKQKYDYIYGVLQQEAEKVKAPYYCYGKDFAAYEENGYMIFKNKEVSWELPMPNLLGDHQIDNAANAIQTLLTTGLVKDKNIIAKGLTKVIWPGRMQSLSHGKIVEQLPKQSEIWLDGSHNADSAIEMIKSCGKLDAKNPAKNILILAMLKHKDSQGYLEEIAKNSKNIDLEIITLPIENNSYAATPASLAELAKNNNLSVISNEDSLSSAIELINNQYSATNPLRIIFTGSLYFVGEILRKNNTPPK